MDVLDTWAWVEYFQGSRAGARLRPLIEKGDVATCVLTFAELSDLHARADRPGLEARLAFIARRGPVLDVTREAAQRAGLTKWAQRAARQSLGLGDAIIYEVARENGCDLVTGDEGFRGLDGVRFVKA
ncbi:MAG TPA: PIN domain-containing protein [Candidatus Thermoplasmatota archaeon]|nr:PIN domain-containing protein [Candidatus Thermoplasmatota archaeon]